MITARLAYYSLSTSLRHLLKKITLMIDTVIFDLDGTLLDTLDDLGASVNYALHTHCLPKRSLSEIRNFLGNGIRNLMTRAAGAAAEREDFEEVFETFRRHYVVHCLDRTAPFPGIIPLLKVLKSRRIKTAIVSNKLHPAVVDLNERFFKEYISIAIGESETVRRKPCPDSVLKAIEALGSRPENTLYVGDSEVDLKTARNAGTACALVLWGFRDEDFLRSLPGAKTFVRRPEDLLLLLDDQE